MIKALNDFGRAKQVGGAALAALFSLALVASAACGDDKEDSTFDNQPPRPAPTNEPVSASSTGGITPCTATPTQSVSAPVQHLCDGGSEGDAEDAAPPQCEDDLAACQRMCTELLEDFHYCGVDDATDGGRIVRCTIPAKICPP
jgi:hypothetical protein